MRALQRAGWEEVRQRGSHVHLKHGQKPGRVTVPVHGGEILHPKTLNTILSQESMTAAELAELL